MKTRLVSSLLLASAFTALAQTNQPVVVELPEITVTAARLPGDAAPLSRVAANVSVIDRKRIESSPAFSLSDLLRAEAGFALFDSSSGFGAHLSGFGLRGFGEKAGTLVLVDGVTANEGGGGGFFWNSVPLENIERVEIIRGGGSTVYGAGAAAGVINIVTRGAAKKPLSVEATGSGGNLGFNLGSLRLSGTTNRFDYRVTGGRQEWSGWRDFSHFRAWNAGTELGYTTEIGRFSVGYDFHTEYSENPGTLTAAQFAANPRQSAPGAFSRFVFDDELHRGTLSYSGNFENGWRVNSKLYHQEYETRFLAFGGIGDESSTGGLIQASYESELFGGENTLTFGGEGRTQFFSQQFGAAAPSAYDNTTFGGFVKDAITFRTGTTLSAALRYDRQEAYLDNVFAPFPAAPFTGTRENNGWSPNVSVVQSVARDTEIWASFAQAYRFPSYNDVVAATPTFVSNKDLVPLKARTVEAGVRTRADVRWSGSLTFFRSWIDNDIFTDPALAFGFSQNSNNDAVRQGVELSLQSRLCEHVSLFANSAYIDAQFDGGPYNGNRQVLVPEWQFSSGVLVKPFKRWSLSLENLYVTGQVRINDAVNAQSRNTYNVVNARLAYQRSRITGWLAINNLLDRRYEQSPATSLPGLGPQTPAHNPAPGLAFQLGMRLMF